MSSNTAISSWINLRYHCVHESFVILILWFFKYLIFEQIILTPCKIPTEPNSDL